MLDDIILQNLGDSAENPTKLDASNYALYYNGVDLDYSQLLDDNDPVIPEGTVVVETPIIDQCVHEELNLHQGKFPR